MASALSSFIRRTEPRFERSDLSSASAASAFSLSRRAFNRAIFHMMTSAMMATPPTTPSTIPMTARSDAPFFWGEFAGIGTVVFCAPRARFVGVDCEVVVEVANVSVGLVELLVVVLMSEVVAWSEVVLWSDVALSVFVL